MLDLELIKRKVSLIQDELKQLTEFEDLTFEKMAHDYRTQAMIERFLERTITRAIDINQQSLLRWGSTYKQYALTGIRLYVFQTLMYIQENLLKKSLRAQV